MIKPLSNKKQQIIELLARFKYLTVSQMLALGVAKHAQNLRIGLNELRDNDFIESVSFGMSVKTGKLENFFFLKPKGAALLEQLPNRIFTECEVKIPKNLSTLFHSDYEHRKATIRFNIEFFKWTIKNQVQIDFVDYYFDTIGSNKGKSEVALTSKNKIQLENTSITPDLIAKIEGTDRSYLFAVEIHRGNDTNRLLKQILWHCEAATVGAIQKKYNYQRAIKTYIILDNAALIPFVCAKLNANSEFKPFAASFLFSSLEELQNDFFRGWFSCGGQPQNFIG